MKKWIVLLWVLPVFAVQAELSISGSGFELSSNCVELETGGVKLSSDECSRAKFKGHSGNRSVHGENNPGKGHKKNKHKHK